MDDEELHTASLANFAHTGGRRNGLKDHLLHNGYEPTGRANEYFGARVRSIPAPPGAYFSARAEPLTSELTPRRTTSPRLAGSDCRRTRERLGQSDAGIRFLRDDLLARDGSAAAGRPPQALGRASSEPAASAQQLGTMNRPDGTARRDRRVSAILMGQSPSLILSEGEGTSSARRTEARTRSD